MKHRLVNCSVWAMHRCLTIVTDAVAVTHSSPVCGLIGLKVKNSWGVGCPTPHFTFLPKRSHFPNSTGVRSHAGPVTYSATHRTLWLSVLPRMIAGNLRRNPSPCCPAWGSISASEDTFRTCRGLFIAGLYERSSVRLLKRVQPGDIVWIHNRPEFAVALTMHIHRAGGRVVLHLHNSHLVNGPERSDAPSKGG